MAGSRNTIAFAAFVAAVAPSYAVAQEYCVACTEPNALYRCVIEDARPGVASSLQVACISRIAREGGHAQCAVKRGVTVFECDGIVKRISLAAEPAQPAAAAPSQVASPVPAPVPAAAPSPPVPPQADGPPKTVAEMAKRAKADSDRQWEQTGSFFKKSLSCITSLFTKCSD